MKEAIKDAESKRDSFIDKYMTIRKKMYICGK